MVARAHPHSRGENSSEAGDEKGSTGSSPLTRGKPRAEVRLDGLNGLIPTHAGKTRMIFRASALHTAHPHSRGENRAFDVLAVGRMGSSPLTRGKQGFLALVERGTGLIPTHAGKTMVSSVFIGRPWAHPHSRGENKRAELFDRALDGSSPLTRGKPVSAGRRVCSLGLIPTHAGKTAYARRRPPSPGAHPHSRGENSRVSASAPSGMGSSPLTRGKHAHPRRRQDLQGLIPTHAGKTASRLAWASRAAAHPHSRGENSVFRLARL